MYIMGFLALEWISPTNYNRPTVLNLQTQFHKCKNFLHPQWIFTLGLNPSDYIRGWQTGTQTTANIQTLPMLSYGMITCAL